MLYLRLLPKLFVKNSLPDCVKCIYFKAQYKKPSLHIPTNLENQPLYPSVRLAFNIVFKKPTDTIYMPRYNWNILDGGVGWIVKG